MHHDEEVFPVLGIPAVGVVRSQLLSFTEQVVSFTSRHGPTAGEPPRAPRMGDPI